MEQEKDHQQDWQSGKRGHRVLHIKENHGDVAWSPVGNHCDVKMLTQHPSEISRLVNEAQVIGRGGGLFLNQKEEYQTEQKQIEFRSYEGRNFYKDAIDLL